MVYIYIDNIRKRQNKYEMRNLQNMAFACNQVILYCTVVLVAAGAVQRDDAFFVVFGISIHNTYSSKSKPNQNEVQGQG